MTDMPNASYVCGCGERFGSEMELQDHARQEHGAMEPGEVEHHRCAECDARFGTLADLRRHQESHADAGARHEQRR